VLTLRVDVERWRAHLRAVHDATPGLVPVLKGNGYGLGNGRLAAEAASLGCSTVAVGTAAEARAVTGYDIATVLVLTPYRPGWGLDLAAPGRLWTVSRVADVAAIAAEARAAGESAPRVVVECLTSMRRHGVPAARCGDLAEAVRAVGVGVRVAGFALHLPLDRPPGVDPAAETAAWIARLRFAGLNPEQVYVSHLAAVDVARLRGTHPDVTFCPRMGTALWLGDRGALRGAGRVVDVHPLARGERVGYRQRRAARDGHVLVVGGGTAHGIGLEAPKATRGVRARGRVVAAAGLAAAGHLRSPFSLDGRRLDFVEPPHMQVSLLWLPGPAGPPAIGAELPVEVRMTTTTFDEILDV
jgi:Alanine racemase, N-terminal domain